MNNELEHTDPNKKRSNINTGHNDNKSLRSLPDSNALYNIK